MGLVLHAWGCGSNDSTSDTPVVDLPDFFVEPGTPLGSDAGDVGSTGTGSTGTGGPGGTGPDGEDRPPGVECCTEEADCPEGLVCVYSPAVSPQGDCAAPPAAGECHTDADCSPGASCDGAHYCGCQPCPSPTTVGACIAPCCAQDDDCADGEVCVVIDGEGACNDGLEAGACWTDDDCDGSACSDPAPCLCGEACGDASAPGQCGGAPPNPCLSDADCPDGTCVAGGACTDDCPAGDPSCCDANACVSDAVDLCKPPTPDGCFYSGCGSGYSCVVTPGQCVPTSCTCLEGIGWKCTDDCVGGECQPLACAGNNPQGCMDIGCPDGKDCVVAQECLPSTCACDSQLEQWVCSNDCGGGVCQ